jgi:hypothetical protein
MRGGTGGGRMGLGGLLIVSSTILSLKTRKEQEAGKGELVRRDGEDAEGERDGRRGRTCHAPKHPY